MERIYLDNNATTFCAEDVIEIMVRTARMPLANPASQHQFGRDARRCLDQATDVLLSSVNAMRHGMDADRLLYCSGGTEANNLAVLGLPIDIKGSILVSAIEHPSILAACEAAQKRGRPVEYIPCLENGIIDLSWLNDRLAREEQSVALVCVMAANNETGVIQPIEQIGQLCRSLGIRFHVDAVQCLGKSSINFQATQADSMTICAHKLHGPVGIGALVYRASVKFEAQILGGLQQSAIRSGTESVMLPVGFAQAVLRIQNLDARINQMHALRDAFESQLSEQCQAFGYEMAVIGNKVQRLPNTSCIAFPPHSRQALQMALDLSGVACSTGSACESGSSTPSHVLLAMGLPERIVQSAIRFSISERTTHSEIEEAIARILRCLRKKSPMPSLTS